MSYENRRLLTVKEAASGLSCSASTVYLLINRGELPYVCVGQSKGYRTRRGFPVVRFG